MLFALSLLTSLACSSSTSVPKLEDPSVLPPDAAGPAVVGTLEERATGENDLQLPLQVWFPASEARDEVYRYDDLFSGQARDRGVADCGVTRPVVLFSHGNGGMRWQSLYWAEHLASHGWIVAAPDHVGNTIFDGMSVPRSELITRRPRDIAAAWARLQELGAAGGVLDGCIDPADGFAMTGHSFGGYTTLAVAGAAIDGAASAAYCADHPEAWLCEDVATGVGDARVDLAIPGVWAAIPMAPAGLEALVGGMADIATPTLVLGGDRDTLTPLDTLVRPLYESLATPERALGTLVDAGHYTFSDACAFLGDAAYDDCAPPYADPAEAQRVANGLALAWLSRAHGEDLWAGWLPPEEPALVWEAP